MELAKNAMELVSDKHNQKELAYAKYANDMKALGNKSRLEVLSIPTSPVVSEARKKYAEEVESLDSKLKVALRNAPRERQAQLAANVTVKAKVDANPDLKDKANKDELKKVKNQALANARAIYGAKKELINITDKEWEAIQAGAISNSKQLQIFNNTDLDSLKQRALPKKSTELSQSKINRIKAYNNNGFTTAEIAAALGVSTSTVSKYLK